MGKESVTGYIMLKLYAFQGRAGSDAAKTSQTPPHFSASKRFASGKLSQSRMLLVEYFAAG
jgi:hypothetical protein